jgi:cytolysin (calcineurin-like family phosphatase)
MRLRNILLLAAITASTAAAQPSWLSIETTKNGLVGSCGAPGEVGCYPNATLCTTGSSNQLDPYTSIPLCEMAAPSCTTSLGIPLNSAGGTDFTFLVITDTHLRNGYGITDDDHLHHAEAINDIPLMNLNWKYAGAGFDDKPLSPTPPLSIVSTGDLTDYGQASEEGAFRLLYEAGRTSDSVNYALYPGLGNHDVSGQCLLDNCAERMFAYPAAAASCSTSVDPLSHNFSWNWHQFHMVQLNMWAGDDTMGSDTETGLVFTHPRGLSWLATDLANTVGNTGAPVILFQHFGFDFFSVYNSDTTGQAKPWWSDSERQALLSILAPYNVVALFSGHQHHTGMYSADYQDSLGNNKILDDFTGGAGGIDGHGEFYAVRLTDNFLDVLPFQWSDSNPDKLPVMTNVGDPTQGAWANDGTWNPSVLQDAGPQPAGTLKQPDFYNNVSGCRKWIGSALKTVPLTVTAGPANANSFSFIITNNSGAPIQGPFALQTPVISPNPASNVSPLNSGAALNSVSFMGSCAEGPAYQELTSNQLAEGQSETITLLTSDFLPQASSMAVVSLGVTDSFLVAPGTVTVGASTPATLAVSTTFGKNIPFTVQADPELTVTVDSTQTPANMTIALNTSVSSFNKLAYVHLQPTTAGYSAAKITVNLATVPITISASGNDPVYVDNVSTAMPQTFNWYPGDTHTLSVKNVQQIDAGTQDRFNSWSATGAASVPPAGPIFSFTVPTATGGYIATYSRYYLVTPTVNPSGSGVISITPPSTDGYQVATTAISVSASANSGYNFSTFVGLASNPTGNTFTATLQAPLAFSANFVPGGTFTVTTQLYASGSETLDGKSYNGPVTQTWTTGSSHTFSVPAVIVSDTSTQYLFTGWSDGVTDNPRTVTAGTPVTYLANYQTQSLITMNVSPVGAGTVTGAGWYNKGASATLTATAAAGFEFSDFSGNVPSGLSPQTLTVGEPIYVVANFQPTGAPTLFASAGARNDSDPAISQFTFELTDSGAGPAVNAQIFSVTTVDSVGTGTISVPNLPLSFGTILPGQVVTQTIPINWPNSATRVGFTVHFTANGGYTGQTTFYVFR